jgi:hypothetical protein
MQDVDARRFPDALQSHCRTSPDFSPPWNGSTRQSCYSCDVSACRWGRLPSNRLRFACVCRLSPSIGIDLQVHCFTVHVVIC